MLPSFVRYHLLTGFDHLFLFFDDHHESDLFRRISKVDQTTCFIQGDLLVENWKRVRHRVDPHVYDHVWQEVMARQQLNVAVAIEAALVMGIDWLLHIDVDEAFYSPRSTVEEHFRGLDQQGVALCHYHNYEAIPEELNILDFFSQTTLFKVSAAYNNAHKQADELIATLPQIPPKFFHFYSNGKSAAKVTDTLKASGVHNFGLPGDAVRTEAGQSQVILHYPCCGFDHFWDKYKTLGAFGDAWYGKVDIRSKTGPTHLDSRDIVTTGSKAEAHQFYKDRFMIDDREVAQKLIDRGYCTRINHVQETLMR